MSFFYFLRIKLKELYDCLLFESSYLERACFDFMDSILYRNYIKVKFGGVKNERTLIKAIKENPDALAFIKNPTLKMCKIAVKLNGSMIKYVPNEYLSKEIRMMAVKNTGSALNFIPNPTEEEIREALLEWGNWLSLVEKQSLEHQKLAVEGYPYSLFYAKNASKDVVETACKNAILFSRNDPNANYSKFNKLILKHKVDNIELYSKHNNSFVAYIKRRIENFFDFIDEIKELFYLLAENIIFMLFLLASFIMKISRIFK